MFPFRPRPVARPSPQERLQVREARKQSQVPGVMFGPDDELTHYRKLAASRAEALAAKTREIERLQHKIMDLEKRIFRFQNVKDADGGEQLKFLTGLPREYWDVLWSDLQPSAENILSKRSAEKEAQGRLNCPGQGRPSVLTLEDELLMTLMRLRLGRMEQELAFVFEVDKSTVCRIFVKWINFMYLRLGDICLWPSAASVMASMPSCFREAYPSTFAIPDATELNCETPSSLPLQSQLYSSYKSHTTKKGLVAIAPNGAFIFVSELHTGSISDRELTKKSGILKLIGTLPPGRLSVMADCGFDIQDLLAKYGVLLNIPPFRESSSSHLPQKDVVQTQKIARVRIHVERAIGQVKNRFHIFDAVPMSMTGSINQIWSVCCLLANYAGPLTAEPADNDN